MNEKEYLLGCLKEECAEMIVAASKILRFGEDESNEQPFTNEKTGFNVFARNNIEELEKEYNDMEAVLNKLVDVGINIRLRRTLIRKKQAKIQVAMEYSRKRGTLDV